MEIESPMVKLARMMSSKWNVRVIFRGSECHTDGKTIVLPSLPTEISKDLVELLGGYLDHEVSHILFSEQEKNGKYIANRIDSYKGDSKKLHTILNILEDARCNTKMMELWEGCKQNIHSVLQTIYTRVISEEWDKFSDWSKLGFLISLRSENVTRPARYLLEEAECINRAGDVTQLFDKVVPIIEKLRLMDLTDSFTANGVIQTLELAEEIMRVLEEPKEEEEKPEEGEEENVEEPADEKGADEEGKEDDSGGEKEGESEDADESTPSEEEGDLEESTPDEEQSGESAQEASPSEEVEGEEEMSIDPLAEFMREAIQANIEKELDEYGDYLIYSTEFDTFSTPKEKITPSAKRNFKDMLNVVQPLCNTIVVPMRKMLLSSKRRKTLYDKRGGKIASKSLHKLGVLRRSPTVTEYSRIFTEQTDKVTLNTAVCLLIDHSGSMYGSRLILAKQSAVVLGEVLDQLRIPFEVLGFTTDFGGYPNNLMKYVEKHNVSNTQDVPYCRWAALKMIQIKAFDESWKSVRYRIAVTLDDNNNLDGESVSFAAARLARVSEKRKVLIVMSDGLPRSNSGIHLGRHYTYLRKVIKQVVDSGIEIIGIGIESKSVEEYYPKYVVVNHISDLPKVLMAEVSKMLTPELRARL